MFPATARTGKANRKKRSQKDLRFLVPAQMREIPRQHHGVYTLRGAWQDFPQGSSFPVDVREAEELHKAASREARSPVDMYIRIRRAISPTRLSQPSGAASCASCSCGNPSVRTVTEPLQHAAPPPGPGRTATDLERPGPPHQQAPPTRAAKTPTGSGALCPLVTAASSSAPALLARQRTLPQPGQA